MYLHNKYSKYYFSIITRAKSRVLDINEQTEKHHILPRSMGGTNETENLVSLTLREHFVCHRLLPKMTEGKAKTKMTYAIWKMCHSTLIKKTAFKLNSRTYNTIKEMMRTSRSSEDFTPEWRKKISDSRKGQSSWNKDIPRDDKTKSKMSATRKQRSADPTWNVRPACRPEKAELIRKANTGKKWVHNPANPVERKQLNPSDCDQYIQSGWVFGIGPQTPAARLECPTCNKFFMPGNINRHSKICAAKIAITGG